MCSGKGNILFRFTSAWNELFFFSAKKPYSKDSLALCLTVNFNVKAIFLYIPNAPPQKKVYLTSRIPPLRKEVLITFYKTTEIYNTIPSSQEQMNTCCFCEGSALWTRLKIRKQLLYSRYSFCTKRLHLFTSLPNIRSEYVVSLSFE
jgi:hypothetical protein